MRILAIILIFSVGLCVSCSIEPPEGQLECLDDAQCPDDWFCDTDDLCYKPDEPVEEEDSDSDSNGTSDDSDT